MGEFMGPLDQSDIPHDFRVLLIDFLISYLSDRPSDGLDYALEYFIEKKHFKTPIYVCQNPLEDSVTSIEEPEMVKKFHNRRKSVFAESYNPEDDNEGCPVKYPKPENVRIRLIENVKNVLVFRSLDNDQLRVVIDSMFERLVSPGDVVIRQGDDGDYFYVVEEGIFEAYIVKDNKETLVKRYDNSGSFGELALLYNVPRAATVKAVTNGTLWAVDRGTFRRIILKSAFKKRKMYESLIESVPMLKALLPYERMSLADALVGKSFLDGERIIKQGDVSDGMYFIEEGTVRITLSTEGEEDHEIKKLSNGDYFGELGLLAHKPRSCTVYAVGVVKVAFLSVDDFERLLGPCMQIMKRNLEDYAVQIEEIFGSKENAFDLR